MSVRIKSLIVLLWLYLSQTDSQWLNVSDNDTTVANDTDSDNETDVNPNITWLPTVADVTTSTTVWSLFNNHTPRTDEPTPEGRYLLLFLVELLVFAMIILALCLCYRARKQETENHELNRGLDSTSKPNEQLKTGSPKASEPKNIESVPKEPIAAQIPTNVEPVIEVKSDSLNEEKTERSGLE